MKNKILKYKVEKEIREIIKITETIYEDFKIIGYRKSFGDQDNFIALRYVNNDSHRDFFTYANSFLYEKIQEFYSEIW